MGEEKLTYTRAIAEIESIIEKIENEELNVDELTEKVKRVSYLVKFCKNMLKKTDEEVKKVLGDEE